MIKKYSLKIILFLLITILGACSSGKKLLEQGDYDRAVYTAVDRLKGSPSNRKARQTLTAAFSYAVQRHLKRIDEAKLSTAPFKWESIVSDYSALNNLANAVENCPACLEQIPDTRKFIKELDDARFYAAEERYNAGKKLLAQGTRESARTAYDHFDRANQFYPDFKDVRKLLDDAYLAAVLKVIVEPVQVNSRLYQLSNEFFQGKIAEFMAAYEERSFVKFYSPEEAKKMKLKADHLLSLSFDDFVVGQTYVKERIQDVKRDSVKLGETAQKRPVYGTVKARVTTFEKTISSSGLLDFRIRDFNNGRIISQEKMPGTFIWRDVWGTFNGDERALTEEERRICRRKEIMPPPPQDLFIEFTKPIYSQLTTKIRGFYSRY
jgi:tetratricopeptide (TPR) repeat protein